KGTRRGIDSATVDAYKELGARYGGLMKDESGPVFKEGREAAESGLPGFLFLADPRGRLPDVGVPFCLRFTPLFSPTGQLTKITDTALKELSGLRHLSALALNHAQVTDAGLKHLASLKSLSQLDLRFTPLPDTGLKHLAGLNKLATLSLYDTGVTDA